MDAPKANIPITSHSVSPQHDVDSKECMMREEDGSRLEKR